MPIVFWSFRVMVGLGLLMIAVGALSLLLRWRGRLYSTDWFLRLCTWCLPIGFIALLAGWFTTETGRQPWVIYGHLRTAQAVSPAIDGPSVLASLVVFFLAYAIVFGAGVYYLYRLAKKGPVSEAQGGFRAARRPLSAPGEGLAGES